MRFVTRAVGPSFGKGSGAFHVFALDFVVGADLQVGSLHIENTKTKNANVQRHGVVLFDNYAAKVLGGKRSTSNLLAKRGLQCTACLFLESRKHSQWHVL